MASQSLYRKWRSQSFSDLVGQEAAVRVLRHAVRDGRLAHAYLFCGPRGTGKTSAARLLAKAANCADPHDGEPCNACLSCREIAEGRSPDVIEIDAASNNSVDDIRELRGNVNVLSAGGRYKVYIVDEVHMLSTQAFNALLKTLEEPPPHVIFVLATTEAHKVLATIASRCQRLDFRRHGRRDIVARLNHVAAGEGLALDPAAAEILARAAQGGMRDALSLLDQAMAFCGREIGLEGVRAMLGLADVGATHALAEHVAAGRAAEGLHLINDLVEGGADLRQLHGQLAELWRALLLAGAGADVARIMDLGPEEASELQALAAQFTVDELTACAQVFAGSETPARGLPLPQLALELAFLECAGIRRRGGPAAAGARPSAAPTVMPGAASAVPTPSTSIAPSAGVSPASPEARPHVPRLATDAGVPPAPSAKGSLAPVPLAPSDPPPDELDLEALDAQTPAMAEVVRRATPAAAEPTPAESSPSVAPQAAPALAEWEGAEAGAPTATPERADGAATDDDWLRRAREQWELVKKVCKQKRRTVAALLHSARPIMVAPGDPLEVVLQADYQFHLEKLREPACRADVEWALEQVLERRCHVRLVLASAGPDGSGRSPAGGPAGGGQPPRGATGDGAPSGNGHAAPTGGGPAISTGNGHTAPGARGRPALVGLPEADAAHDAAPSPAAARPGDVPPPADLRTGADGREGADVAASASGDVALEQQVRADPVVQEIMRAFPAQLIEVRPLPPDETG